MHRVLHVIPSLQWSPAVRQLQIVLKHGSPALHHEVCVLRKEPVTEFWARQAHRRHLEFPGRLDLRGYRMLRAAIGEFLPGIVHAWTHETFCAVRVAVAGRACRWLGSEFSVPQSPPWARWLESIHATMPQPASWAGHQRLVPPWCHAEARQTKSETRVASVEYGVEVSDDATRRRAARDRLCRRLDLPDHARLVGFVGDFKSEQRLKDAIWAADLLKVVRDDLHLLLAGSGPHAARLLRFRNQCQIRDRVHFVRDPSFFDDTLHALDICWVPGQSDLGTPLVIEAMALGIPVISSDTPSHRRLVVPDVTGLMFEVGHRAGLARLTHQLLEDPSRAESLSQTAKVRLLGNNSAALVAAHYGRIYAELAQAH